MSALNCGCDPEAGRTCQMHQVRQAYQRCLDIVCRASDYLQAHPDHGLDTFDVLARIITDIQAAGEGDTQ